MTAMDNLSEIVLPDDASFGPEVQVDYPGYRSTRWRAPDRPLVTLPEEVHSLAGPVFGEDTVQPSDADLTRQHEGEPLGERIIVHGRVARFGRASDPRARSSRSGRRTPAAATGTRSTSIRRRSTRTSPALAAASPMPKGGTGS